MNEQEKDLLIDLINQWYPKCTHDCYNCEWGVLRSHYDTYSCPLELVQNMIYIQERVPKDWKELHG